MRPAKGLSRTKPKPTITLDRLAERYRDDFVGFCALLDIIDLGGRRTKLILNPIQQIYNAARTPRDIVLKPRQVGLTIEEQARDIWYLLTRPGARVVATCQSLSDHSPLCALSARYRLMFESLVREGVDLKFRTEALASWELADREGSLRIVEAGASEAAAAKKGRAGTISRLHISETAFYEYAEETLNAMLECVPAVAHGTEIVSECTANGASGVFFDQYQAAVKGESGYTAHFFPWYMNPDYQTVVADGETVEPRNKRQEELVARHNVSPAQLKWYQQKLAEKKRQDLLDQEYPSDPDTCFLITGGRAFFDRAITSTLHAVTTEPIAIEHGGAFKVWKRPELERPYIVSADPSEGTGGDPGAALVYDRETGEHVASLHGQFPPWKMGRLLAEIGIKYNLALIVVERNNHGHAVLQALNEGQSYPNIFVGNDGKLGWVSTSVSRSAALDALEESHREGEWTTPDKGVTAEMLKFIVNKFGKAEAAPGAHDDLILAGAIGWNVITRAITRYTGDLPEVNVYESPMGGF